MDKVIPSIASVLKAQLDAQKLADDKFNALQAAEVVSRVPMTNASG